MSRLAFWDASALVPLCIEESATPAAHELAAQFEAVAWWGSAVEVYSAFTRLHRFGSLDTGGLQLAAAALSSISQSWHEVLPTVQVRDTARRLLDAYPLRAADRLQLAAALSWCHERPAGEHFICYDLRLSGGSRLAGFTVIKP